MDWMFSSVLESESDSELKDSLGLLLSSPESNREVEWFALMNRDDRFILKVLIICCTLASYFSFAKVKNYSIYDLGAQS